MKRRTLLAGIATGAVMAGTGLVFRNWSTRLTVQHQPLEQFNPNAEFDVCIVGTGPAGCTLAQRLSDAGSRVLLLESGVATTDTNGMQAAFKLDVYSSSGAIDYPLQSSRYRGFGGTSNIWTGRTPRMQPADFSASPYAPSGWPISYTELQPFYQAAEESLHVVADKLTASHAPRIKDLPGNAPQDISPLREIIEPLGIAIDYPPVSRKKRILDDDGPLRFGADLLPGLSKRSNVQVLSNATVTRVLTDSSGRVTGLQAESLGGVNKVVRAERYVVACGGAESNRLLLLSGSDQFPGGLGNTGGHLGHYFMEHPFVSYSAEIPGIKPFEKWLLGRTYQFSEPMREKGLGGVLLGFYSKPSKNDLKISLGIEMAPVAENRIRLNSENRDPFGNPGADIQLAFSERDQELWEAGETIVHDIFSRLQSADIVKTDTPLHWSHHHMGGTRMSVSDKDGVVDPNLRVHGTDNLYVLSSSVFVTSGVANPTLTIVALAHRLSEHLATL